MITSGLVCLAVFLVFSTAALVRGRRAERADRRRLTAIVDQAKVKTQRHGRGKRWRVRNQGARTVSFHRQADANRWDVKVRGELAQGLIPFDHRAGVMTFGEYAEKWMRERYRGRGHRQGESFAVALEDVNRFRKEITIRHQVLRIDGKTVLVPPKNNAVRVVPLAATALNAIDTHVERHDTTRVRCSCCGKDWHVVFTNGNGELIKSWDFQREVWNPTLVTVQLATGKINGQHNLRHAWVSTLMDGGATPKGIQTWAGHKSIKTTYDVYGHLFERAHDRARSIIDQAFSSGAYSVRTAEIN